MIRTFLNSTGIFLCIGCILCTTLYAQDNSAKTYTGAKENLHVYLLIGQSNMAGRAPFSEKEASIIERCYLLNSKDEWEPAKNPLNRYSTIRKKIGMQKMNPGYYFSKAMLEKEPGVDIGLVVNAKGGTKIEQWAKGTDFYNEAIRRTKLAQQTGTLKGILWHQGEGNSGDAATYLEKLGTLIKNLRNDLDAPNLPFVAGQVFYHPEKKPNTKQINDQIAKLPETEPFTGCASSTGLTTFDNTHFGSSGMKILGQRYAEEMQRIQAQNASGKTME